MYKYMYHCSNLTSTNINHTYIPNNTNIIPINISNDILSVTQSAKTTSPAITIVINNNIPNINTIISFVLTKL